LPVGDLYGKVIAITGGNAGIGKETAVALAGRGARVVITTRNVERGAAAVAEVRQRSGNDVEVMPLDLASFASIRSFADQLAVAHERLDVLILNAGGVLAKRTMTEDGHETQFQANHLGHSLLTQLLRDRVVASAPARIVVVASNAHESMKGVLDFDDIEGLNKKYQSFQTYYRTKLMNILFTRELARRLDGTHVTANCLSPGFVASKFAREGDLSWWGNIGMPLTRPFSISPEKGARTSVYLAASPDVAGVTGEYFVKCRVATPSTAAQDDTAASRLWAVSEQLVGATN
jgi:NAD(P)-dependent dehydrogenase (short-subunit alcohol dehydrogenase family)